jgi:hypothetical protein
VCDNILQAGQSHKEILGMADSLDVFPDYLDNWGHHAKEQADDIHQRLEWMRAQHATTCTTTPSGLQLGSRMTAAQQCVRLAKQSATRAFKKYNDNRKRLKKSRPPQAMHRT